VGGGGGVRLKGMGGVACGRREERGAMLVVVR
jgi:hypothetical protein